MPPEYTKQHQSAPGVQITPLYFATVDPPAPPTTIVRCSAIAT
jgi:hypothetical protein